MLGQLLFANEPINNIVYIVFSLLSIHLFPDIETTSMMNVIQMPFVPG
jgi:hypothetical protein